MSFFDDRSKNKAAEAKKVSEMIDELWEIDKSFHSDNPDFQIDYNKLSQIELRKKYDYYADRVRQYMDGRINPHDDIKLFNEDIRLFQYISGKVNDLDDNDNLLILEAMDLSDRIDQEHNSSKKEKEEKLKSEVIEIIEGKKDPKKNRDRVQYLMKKFEEGEWFSIELHDKLFDIDMQLRREEFEIKVAAAKAKKLEKQKEQGKTDRTIQKTVKSGRNTEEENELLIRAEKYLNGTMKPTENWYDYDNLVELFDRYIKQYEVEEGDPLWVTNLELIEAGGDA